jgi:uncharacterized membrane protein HdeD (DUF308 family)
MPTRLSDLATEAPDLLAVHWGWIIALGVLIATLGILAIWRAQLATTLAVGFLGAIVLVSGVSVLLFAFFTGGYWTDLFIHVVWAILVILVGVMLLVRPMIGAQALTLLIAGYLIVEGVAIISFAFATHVEDIWSYLTQGAISLLLAALLIVGWPITGLWAIGTFVGIDLLLKGWMLIALGLGLRTVSEGALF